ncbi:MAG: ankyrin repeat domain-containing protein [Clostridiales bacterium]|nr:ankyrin repeat domain-containing protein [Clostridiales bacterium]
MDLEDKLVDAIKARDVLKVGSILRRGAKVNIRDTFGFTPLMHSAVSGNKEIVRMLLSKGADVECINYRGLNALALAKFNGSKEVYDILKEICSYDSTEKELRLSNIFIGDNNKHSYMDILKREIYCEDDRAKELINVILDNIEKYKDDRIELVMLCSALYTMEKDWTNNNLQIFVTNNIDVSVLKGKVIKDGYLLGAYNFNKNIIQISSFGGEFVATQTFLHELVHKVHISCKKLKLGELDLAYKEVLARLDKFPKSLGSDYIKRNMITRVMAVSKYNKFPLKMLEYLADPIAYILICNKNKNDGDFASSILHILEPIYKVFDEEISTQLMDYAQNNKNFYKLKLSDAMKKKFKCYREVSIKDKFRQKKKEIQRIIWPVKENISNISWKQLK